MGRSLWRDCGKRAVLAALLLACPAIADAAPRKSATALVVGVLVDTRLAIPSGGDEGACLLYMDVGSAAPVPVVALFADLSNPCNYPDGTRLRIKAEVRATVVPPSDEPRIWLQATEVKAR